MAQFGEILAELRQDRGLTQRELAKLFFVTPGTISNYEKGRHLPDAERLIKIADYFPSLPIICWAAVPPTSPPTYFLHLCWMK